MKETPEFAGFVTRAINALARRIGAGDVDSITELAALSEQVDDAMREAITGLRARGYSWAEIGARLGISKQAVHQRWG